MFYKAKAMAAVLSAAVMISTAAAPAVAYAKPDAQTEETALNADQTKDISTLTVSNIPDQAWTGAEVKPDSSVVISDNGTLLQNGVDYQIAGYENNVAAGNKTANVVVNGIGNYTGELRIPFTITKDLIGSDFTVKSVNDKKGVIITWTAAKNAKSYQIYRLKSGKWKLLKTISATKKRTYTDAKLKKCNGKMYQYRIFAIPNRASAKQLKTFKIFRLTHAILQKPIVSSSFGQRPSVYWVSNKKSGGYQLQFKTGKKVVKRKIKGGKKAGCKMPKSWSGKTKVRVRCYKKVSGVTYYSAWSNWKSVKIY